MSATRTQLTKHNGWTNYPTWAIHLWITNSEAMTRAAEAVIAAAQGDWQIAADNLREWAEAIVAEESEGMVCDLAGFAAQLADWRALVVALADDGTQGDYEDSLAYRLGW